jgi:hypothetical protein
MDRGTVPHNKKRSPQVPSQVLEKSNHCWTPDSTRVNLEVEALRRYASDDRSVLPAKMVPENRGLPYR